MVVFYGFGILFMLLGVLMFWSAARRPEVRERAIYSGMGSIMVGVGNVALPTNLLIGAAILILGVFVVFASARGNA